MKYLKALAAVGLVAVLATGQVQAQVAGFSFSNVTAGVNDPTTLGGASTPFDVWSDSGALVKATFTTLSPSTQFGIHDNVAIPLGDSPMSGNILFGGVTNYPTDDDVFGAAVLQIVFSAPIDAISFDLLTGAQTVTGGSEALNLDLEAVGVGTGVVPASWQALNSMGYYWQASGITGSSPTAFTTLILSVTPSAGSSYAEFGLDNLTIHLTEVPEPGVLALFVGAGVPLALWVRRRTK